MIKVWDFHQKIMPVGLMLVLNVSFWSDLNERLRRPDEDIRVLHGCSYQTG